MFVDKCVVHTSGFTHACTHTRACMHAHVRKRSNTHESLELCSEFTYSVKFDN